MQTDKVVKYYKLVPWLAAIFQTLSADGTRHKWFTRKLLSDVDHVIGGSDHACAVRGRIFSFSVPSLSSHVLACC
jgi:hypothetical protein